MAKIFDTHAHYDSDAFDEDRDEFINNLLSNDVCGFINCASDLKTSEFSLQLAHRYPGVYAAIGFHPENLPDDDFNNYKDSLCEMLKDPKAVAVGETGLEYHYDCGPKERQIEWFEKHLQLAVDLDKPIIIHDREAHGDTMTLLNKYRPNGVLHCFSGSAEMMKEIVKLGMYIGLGGAVTFKNARVPVEVAMAVPADRLLLETDCPYMSPVPFRGERNDSSKISFTAEKIAEVRNISKDNLLEQCYLNAKELFGI